MLYQAYPNVDFTDEEKIQYGIMEVFGEEETLLILNDENYIVHYDCKGMEDVVYNYIEECGIDAETAGRYFDMEKFIRDLELDEFFYDFTEEDCELDDYSKEMIAEDLLEDAILCKDVKTLMNYFDYEKLGNDLAIEGNFIQVAYNIIVEVLY